METVVERFGRAHQLLSTLLDKRDMVERHNVERHGYLVHIKGDFSVSLCVGSCNFLSLYYKDIKYLTHDWQHYSGSYMYPVPPEIGLPYHYDLMRVLSEEYYDKYSLSDKSLYGRCAYGQARWAYLHHLHSKLTYMINTESYPTEDDLDAFKLKQD